MTLQNNNRIIAWLALLSGLSISAVAVYYSVAGLVSIFAAAAIPIMIMGIALEVSKLVATVWLKQNWFRAPKGIKYYLTISVVVLMLITSMGIFGFLSKAHLDQAVPTGDVAAKVAIIDEKIKTEKDNVDAARRALTQMDNAVDQTMSRSTAEQGADKAVAIRRSQAKERSNLQNEIATAQKKIAALNEERAPIASELRKVEAEVGPIKYIAALIYGDNPDANVLEKAVTWVIMIIIFVFDPLAVLLLLASQLSFGWLRDDTAEEDNLDDDLLPEDEVEDNVIRYNSKNNTWTNIDTPEDNLDAINRELAEAVEPIEIEVDVPLVDEAPFRGKGLAPTMPLGTQYQQPVETIEEFTEDDYDNSNTSVEEEIEEEIEDEHESADVKLAKAQWKAEHPGDTLKHQKHLLDLGLIAKLPWEQDQIDERPGDYVSKAETYMENIDGQQINKPVEGEEGYVQNAEQTRSSLWQKVHKP